MNSTLREREESKHQNEKTVQLKMLNKEIGELKCAISDNKKISEKLNKEFLPLQMKQKNRMIS